MRKMMITANNCEECPFSFFDRWTDEDGDYREEHTCVYLHKMVATNDTKITDEKKVKDNCPMTEVKE